MIEATGIVAATAGGVALDGLTLHVTARERVGVAVPDDGSGSLLLRIVAGLVRPSSGAVMVDGVDVVSNPLRVRDRIVYVAAAIVRPAPLLVAEWIQSVAAARGVNVGSRSRTILERVGLTPGERVERLGCDKRGVLALATAVAVRPKVALLDAPLRDVDSRRRSELMAWALEELTESTVVLSSNDQVELALCHRRLRLTSGLVEAESKEQMRCAG